VILEEQFDADDVLRDVDESSFEDVNEEDTRELNFGNFHDDDENYKDIANDLGDIS
jgi:hypothetical protein